MNRQTIHAAASALLLSFACNREAAHDPPPSLTGTTTEMSDSESPPAPSADGSGAACRIDADCGASRFCELRICVDGCTSDDACEAGASCDPHGRCAHETENEPARLVGAPVLVERFSVLAFGETQARTTLRNEGPDVLAYRLAAASSAVAIDPAPYELAPGGEVELIADIDLAALAPADRMLPVQIITSGGAILWSLEILAVPESGQFRGAVSFDAGGFSLASSELIVDLDFRDDGTIAGRVDTDASFLWPLPLALTGTWAATGDFTIMLRDRLPADGWRSSPIGRELGRELVLTGTRATAGLEGTVVESITGLRDAPVQVSGGFALRRHGPLTGLVHPPDDLPTDAKAPPWLAPPGLDTDACEGLGVSFGTSNNLVEPSPECDACASGNCTPEDMAKCGDNLRDSVHNLPDVLAALHGSEIKPPTGAWTWDDCTADSPTYNDDGQACLDIAALRCAHALIRRGCVQVPGPAGELCINATAIYAADEANAAALLATEAQIDVAFAYKDDGGEPVADALARELKILEADRTRLAAALAPTLAPAYSLGLAWIEDHNFDQPIAQARLAPLALVADFARTTSQWARLAPTVPMKGDTTRRENLLSWARNELRR